MKINSQKIRCLILDHDDTAVESTAAIHYPSHLETMKLLRPHLKPVDLETWFLKNFDPGIGNYLSKELGFSEQEMLEEYEIWKGFTSKVIPEFFPGFIPLVQQFRKNGGVIAIVSHSDKEIIRRDYRIRARFEPDMIFGWDFDENKRKPHPWPVHQILKEFDMKREEALILDDLKPAVLMAREAGVAIAGAGWGHKIGQIRDYMEQNCDLFFENIEGFSNFLFSSGGSLNG